MKKLAVFFPGIGYTVDRPLLYYSQKIAKEYEYDIKLLPYNGFPDGVRGNKDKMLESFNIALNAAKEMLSDTNMDMYDEVLFVAKSVGTVVATKIAEELYSKDVVWEEKLRLVLYTPLEATFKFEVHKAIAFTGTADPWVGGEASTIAKICHSKGIKCISFEGANHSLETGDLTRDMEYLSQIIRLTKQYISIKN